MLQPRLVFGASHGACRYEHAWGVALPRAMRRTAPCVLSGCVLAGEGAGLAMGLILVGSSAECATEMLAYAHDTQHEKIIRGLGLGLALVMYGKEEGADPLIEQVSCTPCAPAHVQRAAWQMEPHLGPVQLVLGLLHPPLSGPAACSHARTFTGALPLV